MTLEQLQAMIYSRYISKGGRKVKKICANCTFWKRKVDFKGNDKFGDCANEHFVYSGDGSEATIDGMKYWDYESYSAGFETGENFGCIHFAKKDSDLTESAQGTK